MNNFINDIIKWSEVWALIIPLAIIIIYPAKKSAIRLIVIYVIIAFLFNIISLSIQVFKGLLPGDLRNNNVLYNIHSVARVILFGLFLSNIKLMKFVPFKNKILPVYLLLVVLNFIFLEDPFFLSSNLYAIESILLLFLSYVYFLRLINDDSKTNWIKQPAFFVCAGIALYEVTNFFIFLFFNVLKETNYKFGMTTMKIFSISYILLCVMLAIAIYRNNTGTLLAKDELESGPGIDL